MVFSNTLLAGSAAQGGSVYEIEQSIRFDDTGPAYMRRTPSSASNKRTWTYSLWIKRGDQPTNYSAGMPLLHHGNSGTGLQEVIRINTASGTTHSTLMYYSDSPSSNLTTTQVFRDSGAWYHIVVAKDTTQSISTERIKIYVNGQRVTSFSTETYPSLNGEGFINSNVLHNISADQNGGSNYDGYMAELNFIDGSQLDPSNFGETNSKGIWIPKEYEGSYGTNGWHIDGRDASDLGDDESGNGNDWATTNLATHDQFLDSPTNNFFVMNNLSNRNYRLFDGNMNVDIGSNETTHNLLGSTIGIHPSATGKYYFEIQWTSSNDSGNVDIIGFADLSSGHNFIGSTVNTGSGYGIGYKVGTGSVYAGNGWTANSFTFAGPVSANYYGFAYDASTGRLYIYQNGSALNSGAHVATFDKRSTIGPGLSIYNSNKRYNFYNGAQTSLSNDNFNYAPPSGYGPINSQNLGADYG